MICVKKGFVVCLYYINDLFLRVFIPIEIIKNTIKMRRNFILTGILSLASLSLFAQKQEVKDFRYSGPYQVVKPIMVDSVDLNSSKYDLKSLLSSSVNAENVKGGIEWNGEELPGSESSALHLLSFDLQNRSYFKACIWQF